MTERNKIGVFGSLSYIVATIIGSGIFIAPTAILSEAGSVGLSLIVWIVAGCIALISSFVYTELGTSIPESGCDFAYISYVGWHPLAFAFLWTTTIIMR
ncbi:hypothetical protein AB6A40_011360 [Gnathostoma spinigerum]|uniref:Amino acid transporter n=1 Tax=Gnathostoma spinigerum TaxID=75299 RepID=A0ABD6EXL4_9BILA